MPPATRTEPRSSAGAPPSDAPRRNLSISLRKVAALFLVTALVAVPLDYAGTRPTGTGLLVGLVGVAGLFWIAGLRQERRLPWAGPVLLLGLGCLVVAAIPWICELAEPTAVADFSRAHFAKVAARWPSSVLRNDVGMSVALHASQGLALWMTVDLARDRTWLVLVATTMVATAVIIALLALMQNRLPVAGLNWMNESDSPGFHWGPFFHHTSAGAYLNTVWPLAAGLALTSRRLMSHRRFQFVLYLASFIALTVLLGAHTSHVSRFPQVAALAIVPLLFIKLNSFCTVPLRTWIAATVAGVALLAIWGGRTSEIAQRWQLLHLPPAATVQPTPPENRWPSLVREDLLIPNRYNAGRLGDRGEAQLTAVRALAARPITGHGPGNWLGAASQFSSDPYVRTFYLYLQFAHADFLQAWVESGFPGFVSLLCLLAGGVLVILRSSSMSPCCRQNILSFAAALGLGAVLLQSLIDFPLQIPAVALNAHVLAGLCWAGAQPAISSASSSHDS